MATFYIKKSQIDNNKIIISDDDLHHIKDVLRLKCGEEVEFYDEDEVRYTCKLAEYRDKTALFNIEDIQKVSIELPVNITLYQGLPKSDKMEFIIQKGTELGLNTIVPVVMDRSITKLDNKNFESKKVRWEKIAKEAASQSRRQHIPQIYHYINFENIIENVQKYDIVLLPYENENNVSLKDAIKAYKDNGNIIKNIAIIIGPEGGFSQEEINKISNIDNVKIVTLGKRILRTETAGISAISMLVYEFEL